MKTFRFSKGKHRYHVRYRGAKELIHWLVEAADDPDSPLEIADVFSLVHRLASEHASQDSKIIEPVSTI